MKARPILFSAPMIRALLAGTKTQTRRAIKPQPAIVHGDIVGRFTDDDRKLGRLGESVHCPYGAGGDLLWVRETWARYKVDQDSCQIAYRATPAPDWPEGGNWRPSIFMPRQHSRITLRITEVRVQRLQVISEQDALAEGCMKLRATGRITDAQGGQHAGRVWATASGWYRELWDSINGAGAWDANPFVWALTFEVIRKNVDEVQR